MKRLLTLIAVLALVSPTVQAQESMVGYTDADTTLYVSSTAPANGYCTINSPCTPATAVAQLHSRAFINKRVKIQALAGTFTTNAVDLYGNVTDRAAFMGVEGTPVTATLDGGHTTGLCTWGDGSYPTRATCTAGVADGGWATSGLIPMYARLGAVNSTYPDGTCGTFQVESNTATAMTVEASSDTSATYPAGCTGVLPFRILDQGTIFTGTRASDGAGAGYPPGVVALPDGGALDPVVPLEESGRYGLGIRAGAGGQGAATAFVRWVRLDPGAMEASGVYLGQGANVTLDHVRCDTTNEGSGHGGACLFLAGGGSKVTIQHSQALKRSTASAGGWMIGSRVGSLPSTLRGYNNIARETTWWHLHSPITFTWDVNYSRNPGATPYVHGGALGTSAGDVVELGTTPMFLNIPVPPLPSFPLAGTWFAPQWTGDDVGQTSYVLGDQRSNIRIQGAGTNINFPNIGNGAGGAVFCADHHSDLDLSNVSGGTFSAGDAGFLVDYSWNCSRTGQATTLDVFNGTSGTPSGSGFHALCGGVDPADGGVLNVRAGCVELPPT